MLKTLLTRIAELDSRGAFDTENFVEALKNHGMIVDINGTEYFVDTIDMCHPVVPAMNKGLESLNVAGISGIRFQGPPDVEPAGIEDMSPEDILAIAIEKGAEPLKDKSVEDLLAAAIEAGASNEDLLKAAVPEEEFEALMAAVKAGKGSEGQESSTENQESGDDSPETGDETKPDETKPDDSKSDAAAQAAATQEKLDKRKELL